MRIVRHAHLCPEAARGAVIALGNFDGVHLGHRAVIGHAIDIARKTSAPAAVMTFEPHPREFFSPDKTRLRMYPLQEKLAMLKDIGVDVVFLMHFNKGLAATSAHDFVDDVLHTKLKAAHVVTGYDFAFGKGREGNTEMLAQYAQAAGFGFTAYPQVLNDTMTVSSSAIRALLTDGKVEQASRLLGQPYRISGHVRSGEARGRTLGIPTANISLSHLFKPRLGVYAVRARLAGEPVWHDAVASIGTKPTFTPTQALLEVYIFDFSRSIYGQKLEVEFYHFLRPELRFSSAEALITQMHADISDVKSFFSANQPACIVS